jgi:hypothetical protein
MLPAVCAMTLDWLPLHLTHIHAEWRQAMHPPLGRGVRRLRAGVDESRGVYLCLKDLYATVLCVNHVRWL